MRFGLFLPAAAGWQWLAHFLPAAMGWQWSSGSFDQKKFNRTIEALRFHPAKINPGRSITGVPGHSINPYFLVFINQAAEPGFLETGLCLNSIIDRARTAEHDSGLYAEGG